MKTSAIIRIGATALALRSAAAHTWVEQLQLIDPATGNYTGNFGYPRGYLQRTAPGFDGNKMQTLLPTAASGRTRIDSTDLLCRPEQRESKQTDGFPVLKAAPGSFVALKYTENGHVTIPENQPGKPKSGGTVYVFGTTKPKSDEKLTDVLAWTKDGSGGDGRGKLLAAQNYDDGRCYQVNDHPISKERQKSFPNRIPGQPNAGVTEQWCEADVQIPKDVNGDQFTVYYVWDWPTTPGVDPGLPNGKDEFYTTCMDIAISNVKVSELIAAASSGGAAKFKLDQQDPQPLAVKDFQSRTAISSEYTPRGATATATTVSAASSVVLAGTTVSNIASFTDNADRQGGSATAAPTTLATSTKPAAQPATQTAAPDEDQNGCGDPTITVTETIVSTVFAAPSKRAASGRAGRQRSASAAGY